MKELLTLFEKLGDECLTCEKPFDKTSKEHVQTWKVVVREDKNSVRLYCPECWNKVTDIIKQVEENNERKD
jgi:DNA-directed RNA polymerase subunit RPC12/RpoP